MTEIQRILWILSDADYAAFQRKLTPGIAPELFMGVRVPDVRKLAKELAGTQAAEDFLSALPHRYYDENMLHAVLLEKYSRDISTALDRVEAFLPFVDNWAVCDVLKPRVFAKHKSIVLEKIKIWAASSHTYICRFGMEMLMNFFLDKDFLPEYLEIAANVRSEEYYVRMMAAWFFATALAKQWDATVPYITEHRLDTWTHNKAIQKARESFRITAEQKEYLNSLKSDSRYSSEIPVGFGWRRAGLADREAVRSLYASVIGGEFCTWNEDYPGDTEFREDTEKGRLWLLLKDGAPAGAVSLVGTRELDELPLWESREAPVEIARVAVAPAFQGRGLAAHMVRTAEAAAAAAGARTVHLLVAVKNIPAYKTYRKLGYEVRGQVEMFESAYYACEKKI